MQQIFAQKLRFDENDNQLLNIDPFIASEDLDWRELIYRMAQDYFKYAHLFDDFEIRVRAANKELFPKGITGYEHYYTDMISFWRYLYNPELQEKVDKEDSKKKTYV